MSQCRRIIEHPGFERIKTLYNDQFPIEVRFACADWIEERMRTELLVDINDALIEQRAKNFLETLIQKVDFEKQKLHRPEEMPILFRLNAAIDTFQKHLYNPFVVYKQIRDAIQSEQYFLDYCNSNSDGSFTLDTETTEINKSLEWLQNAKGYLTDHYDRFQKELEHFHTFEYTEPLNQLQMLENNNVTTDLENARLLIMEETKQKKCAMLEGIHGHGREVNEHVQYVITEIGKVQKKVIENRLGAWQLSQAHAGNGSPLPMNTLDEVQVWMQSLAEFIWFTRSLISKIRALIIRYQLKMLGDLFDIVYKEITMLMQNLIVSAFIVEKQPPQVMKTNTRFTSTVRFLLTNIGVQEKHPSVVVSILSETQAQSQQKNLAKPIEESCGDILNNSANLEIQASGHLTCNLRNMQLKKIKRAEKKSTESVMDEKFALRFKSTFQCSDIQINVWVISLPVVVIVHGNQEPQSWATITWDNAFGQLGRIPFAVADRVPWSRMAEMLNMKFASQTGRGLSLENLQYLSEKAFRAHNEFDSNDKYITWTQFCKETLPSRTFTFWDWFYSIMKLTRHHLRNSWSEGRIMGFISKKQAEEMLLKCSPGTFLLRYSDSELGGITIAYVGYQNLKMHVTMLTPFSQKDFAIRSLSDRIKDLSQCVTLYPDIPKDTAFGSYYTPLQEVTSSGYVKPLLKIIVPGENRSATSSYSSTPQYNTNWQSPDYQRDTSSVGSSNDLSMDSAGFMPNYDGFDGLLDPDMDALMKM